MPSTNRREFLETGLVAAATMTALGSTATAATAAGTGLAFGNRVHIHAHPSVKEKLTWCFSTVLGCGAPMSLNAAGLAEPMLAFKFPGGGSLSVEFTDQALTEDQIK